MTREWRRQEKHARGLLFSHSIPSTFFFSSLLLFSLIFSSSSAVAYTKMHRGHPVHWPFSLSRLFFRANHPLILSLSLFVSLCGNSSTNASISHAIHYLTLATWLWVPRRHLRDGFYFLRRQITAKYSVAFNSTAITHNLSAELLRPRSWPLTASGLQRRMLNDTLVSARALG